MDILLNDIRLASVESAGIDQPADQSRPPFSVLLGELPQKGAEPAPAVASTAAGFRLPMEEKLIKISNLEDFQELGDRFVAGLSASPDESLDTSSAQTLLQPTKAAAGVAEAVGQIDAAAPERPQQPNVPPPVVEAETGPVLPPGGNHLPQKAGLQGVEVQADAERSVADPDLAARAAVSAESAPLSPEPKSRGSRDPLPATVSIAPAVADAKPRDIPAVALQDTETAAVIAPTAKPTSRAEPSTPAPVPADAGLRSVGPLLNNADMARAIETVEQDEAQRAPIAHARVAAVQPAPVALRDADIDSPVDSLPARGFEGLGTPKTDPARPQAVPATIAEPKPPAPAVETSPRESWLRANLEGNPAARGELRLPDSGQAAADPLTETAGTLRESPLPRAFEQLQVQAAQANTTPAVATPVVASSLPAGPGFHHILPPQLETMTLARDAAAADWGEGIGERVSWLINHKQNTASIRLDPPALGRLDVQIRIADDAATITIQAQQVQTRDLIDAAVPRLREFLQDAGFQNVNVDVSHRQDQQLAQGQRQPGDTQLTSDEPSLDAEADFESSEIMRGYRGDGLVDIFA